MTGTVLVTGGGKGVGAAIVESLVASGFDVDFTYRSSEAAAHALAQRLQSDHPGRSVNSSLLDLADKKAVADFCTSCEDKSYFGFVHNAGQPYDALAVLMNQDKAEEVMQVNFWSFTCLVKTLVRPMIRSKAGRIVAMGSVAALQGNAGNSAYAASKGALMAYCRTLAIETAKRGVTVNVLAPGFINTDMMTPYASYRDTMEKQIPAGRFANPQDIAGLVAFLMSPPAAYITGTTLPIDGGLTAMMGVHR